MKRSSSVSFWLFSIGLVGVGIFSLVSLNGSMQDYDKTQAVLDYQNKTKPRSITVQGSDRPIYLASPELLAQGNIWGLISRDHPLPASFTPPDLVDTSVAHGDSNTHMQVQRHIEAPLRALFAAGESDGVELMLSSAYRSISDQKKLYNQYVAEQGVEAAKTYVAAPGSSEHHTGLSIDFASASAPCEMDSDDCSLSQSDAAWLRENGPKFGFIQRYPDGKKDITGVGFEPWHYRYVGVALAREIAKSNQTLDQVIEQLAPGLKK